MRNKEMVEKLKTRPHRGGDIVLGHLNHRRASGRRWSLCPLLIVGLSPVSLNEKFRNGFLKKERRVVKDWRSLKDWPVTKRTRCPSLGVARISNNHG